MRMTSGLMLTMLLIGMLTFAFGAKPVKPESFAQVSDGGPADFSRTRNSMTMAGPTDIFRASRTRLSKPTIGSFLENGLDTQSRNIFHMPFESSVKLDSSNEVNLCDSARVYGDSAELVIGLDEIRSSSYSELLDLIVGRSGKLVNTVSMDGSVAAVVADIPSEAMPVFVSEVEISKLSRYIEPNVRLQVDFTPNDPYWSLQWGPQEIGADWAWNTTVVSNSVLVAVVDTGIDYNHPDLVANYIPLGYDWVNNDPYPMDDFGHGTHVAGTIAATINNGIGIAGLANVRIMAEKVMDADGYGALSEIVQGIIHAVNQGAKIINLSLGSYFKSNLLHDAVRYARDQGVLVVAAAGNDATSQKHYPAAYDEVVAVSATDESDKPATFSDYGDWVDVAAPGVSIYSTMPTYHVTMNDNDFNLNYDYMSGTSMACPHVSGVAALILSKFPNMTQDQVLAQLQYSANDLGEPGFDVHYGFGRVNARQAVEQAPSSHDVLVLNLRTPSYVSLGKAAVINTTVLNMGNSNESDITVHLLINGSAVNSAKIDFLTSGASIAVSLSWNATSEGVYNVTSHVVPVIGETIVGNNALSKQLMVRLPQTIRVPDDYSTIQAAIDAANEGDTVSVASGTYYENVWINKEGLTLIGKDSGTIIDGNGAYDVIVVSADNVQISHFRILDSGNDPSYYPPLSGVLIYSSEGAMISETVVSNNMLGIGIFYSNDVTLRNNSMRRNTYNFGVDGDGLEDFVHCIDASNTVDDKPLYYCLNEHDKQVPSDAGYVAVVNSTNIVVKDLNLRKNFEGVLFAHTTNSFVQNVSVSKNYFGIYLAYSKNNTIHSDTATNNEVGNYLHESASNDFFDSTLTNNGDGFNLYYSNYNVIDSAKLLNNDFGLYVEKSDNNTMNNVEVSEGWYGILLERSSYNVLRNDSLTDNIYNFGVDGDDAVHFIHDADASNTVDEKPIIYLVNSRDLVIDSSTFPEIGYLGIVNSSSINVRDLNFTNNLQGILLAYTNSSTIRNTRATSNLWGMFIIGSSSDVVSGNTLTENQYNIDLWYSKNNTVRGNSVTNGEDGAYLLCSASNNIRDNIITSNSMTGLQLVSSDSNSLTNNTVSSNGYGMELWYSGSNTLEDNNVNDNGRNFGVEGLLLSHFIQDIDTSNTVNGKPVYYWVNQHDGRVPADAGYVAVVNSTNITVADLNVANNVQGILFAYTTNSTIKGNTVANDEDGIRLFKSSYNTISQNNATQSDSDCIDLYISDHNAIASNTVTDASIGIRFTASDDNIVNSNTVLGNGIGIYLYYSTNSIVLMNRVAGGDSPNGLCGICLTGATGNLISANIVLDNKFLVGAGIYLEWSSDNNIVAENIIRNNQYGISMGYGIILYGLKEEDNNNTVYHNNFIRNTKEALSLNSINTWDDGYPSGGNYWSEYKGTDLFSGAYQNEANNDGIGDVPYIIGENNTDRYPLMKAWQWPVLGDINYDFKVDMGDIIVALNAFGSFPTHPRWNPAADTDSDGRVTMNDIVTILVNFGKQYP